MPRGDTTHCQPSCSTISASACEGHEQIERYSSFPVDRHQLGTDGCRLHPLPHGCCHAEFGGDILDALPCVDQRLEGLELIGACAAERNRKPA
jgi:hypothetical protein